MNVKRLVVVAATAILAVVGITAVRAADEAASRGSDGNEQSGDGRGPATLAAVVPGHVRVSLEIAVSVLSRGLAGVIGLERTGSEEGEPTANGADETTTVAPRRE
jgi:hypothetical protein